MSGEYDDYEDPIEELANRIANKLVGTPQVRQAISGAENLFDTIGRGIDRAGEFVARGPSPRAKRSRPPRVEIRERVRVVEKPVEAAPDPRIIMGFPADTPLSRSVIKERHRALAPFFHPDRGGSVESMQRLNAAAEALLREIG